MLYCLECNNILSGRQKLYCSVSCKQSHNYRKKKISAKDGLKKLLELGFIDNSNVSTMIFIKDKILIDSNVKGLPLSSLSINDKGYAIFPTKYGSVSLHRVVMELNGNSLIHPYVIDHINRNKLDNRLNNLRITSLSVNSQNSPSRKNKKASKYKGVHQTASGKWQPQIWFNGKNVGFGSYETEEEAALVYNMKAVELFGPNAYLNVIKQSL